MRAEWLVTVPALTLSALLALAVWYDIRSRRIPNRLVYSGALAALLLQTALPAGAGLFATPFGGIGLLLALAGLATGLLILLPMYMLGAMGAGDVKLMAMVGAFLGPQATLGAALQSLLAGGLLALVVALWNGALINVLQNIYHVLRHSLFRVLAGEGVRVDAPPTSTGKLAYAIAIACGTLSSVFLAKAPFWSLL